MYDFTDRERDIMLQLVNNAQVSPRQIDAVEVMQTLKSIQSKITPAPVATEGEVVNS